MSRREIRRMLMEPKQRLLDRPWVVPVMMAVVLAVGVGLGVGVGLAVVSGKKTSDTPVVTQAAQPVVQPVVEPAPALAPPVEQAVQSQPAEPVSQPNFPVPPPRPGGPADDPIADEADPVEAPPAAPLFTTMPPDQPVATVAAAKPIVAPPSVTPASGAPAWLRHAVLPPRVDGQPMIAVVIDDLGVDRRRSERMIGLKAPLTLSWMTYAEDLPRLTKAAHAAGHELMVHMPMQPRAEGMNAGPGVLEVGMSQAELLRRITWGLERFEGYVGVNNHMGSRFTGDRAGMTVVLAEMRRRGLLYLDSVTTEKSVVPDLAQSMGVPFAARHVFIDNVQSVALVLEQLHKAEQHARRHGFAIAIGHPHDTTHDALAQWLPSLGQKGLVLVPLTTIVKKGGAMPVMPAQEIKED